MFYDLQTSDSCAVSESRPLFTPVMAGTPGDGHGSSATVGHGHNDSSVYSPSTVAVSTPAASPSLSAEPMSNLSPHLQAGGPIPAHLAALDDSTNATGATAVGASQQTFDSFLQAISTPPVVFVPEYELIMRGEETMRSILKRSPKEGFRKFAQELDAIASDNKATNELPTIRTFVSYGYVQTASDMMLALIDEALSVHQGCVKSLREVIDLEMKIMATPAEEHQRGRLQALSALVKPREQMIKLLPSRRSLLRYLRATDRQ